MSSSDPIDAPAGFERKEDSGLYVPEKLARQQSRMTPDDRKMLLRAVTMLANTYGIEIPFYRCQKMDCPDRTIKQVASPDGVLLRCGHRDVLVEHVEPARMSAKTRRRRGIVNVSAN